MSDTKWREIRRDLADPDKNPFRPGTPLYRLFEEIKLTSSGVLNTANEPSNQFDATGDPDWLGTLFTAPQRIKDLEKQLQKVNAHNDQLVKDLNTANAVLRETIDANGKLYDEARKSTSKVDALYKATNTLAELCTTLIRTLK